MPAIRPLAAVQAASRLRRLVRQRRRAVAALLAADTVLLGAAAMVWLPLLAPERATTPVAPSPSIIVSPSPTVITRFGPPPVNGPGSEVGDERSPQPTQPRTRPKPAEPNAPPTWEAVLPLPLPLPPISGPPLPTVAPSPPPTEHETPPIPEPSPVPEGPAFR